MSNPEKTSTSADKEEDEEERRTNTDQAVTTTTINVLTPAIRVTRTVQVRPASGERKRSKSSAVKGAGSTTSTKTGKRKRKYGELDVPKGEPICPICGRKFDSWKGYFGHLRVHPQGLRSGAFPPPISNPPGKKMVDEQFQDCMASELTRIGVDTHHTGEFDLNLPPRRNIDSDDDDCKKDDDEDATAP